MSMSSIASKHMIKSRELEGIDLLLGQNMYTIIVS